MNLRSTIQCVRRNWIRYLVAILAIILIIIITTWATVQRVQKEHQRDIAADIILQCTTPGHECYARQQQNREEARELLLRTIDCAVLISRGVVPEPCEDAAERIEKLRENINPFQR